MASSPVEIICSTVYKALENIASVLNVPKDKLIKSETLAECSFARSCSSQMFTEKFSNERLEGWYSALGSDLTIGISIEERDTYEQITRQDWSGLKRILNIIDTYEIDLIEIRVTLKKEALKARIRDVLNAPSIDALFFFEQILVDSLTLKNIQDMQQKGIFLADQYTIIAVLTASGLLQSPFMTTFGLQDATIEDFSRLPKIKPIQRTWNRALSLRDTNTVWAAPLADISPDAFQVTQIHAGLEATYETMRGICNILSLLQFCVSVLEDGEKWHVSIARLADP